MRLYLEMEPDPGGGLELLRAEDAGILDRVPTEQRQELYEEAWHALETGGRLDEAQPVMNLARSVVSNLYLVISKNPLRLPYVHCMQPARVVDTAVIESPPPGRFERETVHLASDERQLIDEFCAESRGAIYSLRREWSDRDRAEVGRGFGDMVRRLRDARMRSHSLER